jgi:hypothetical protein
LDRKSIADKLNKTLQENGEREHQNGKPMERRKSLAREAKTKCQKSKPEEPPKPEDPISIASNLSPDNSLNKTERVTIKSEPLSDNESEEKTHERKLRERRVENETSKGKPSIGMEKSSKIQKPPNILETQDPNVQKVHKSIPKQTIPILQRPQVQQIFQQMSNNNSMVFIPVSNFKEVPPLAAINTVKSVKKPGPQSQVSAGLPTLGSKPPNNLKAPTSSTNNLSSSVPKPTPTEKKPETAENPKELRLITSPPQILNGSPENEEPVNMLVQTAGISSSLASAVTDAISCGPPKLARKPSGALKSDGDAVYPSMAGPVSRVLVEHSHRMADFFRSVIEDTLADLAGQNLLEAKVKILEAEIEKLKYVHAQEMTLLKHNTGENIQEF